ncbi:MAG: ferritin-like domain-containing protein [Myxococcales bacterium]|nr:ferritin-like domain-containing protein [Myxococcales bacterium]
MMLDLRAEAAAHPIDTSTWPVLDANTLAQTRATWRGRMVNEHASAQVFAALLPQLMRAGVPAAVLADAAAMPGEELHHGRLCAAVLWALGEAPLAPLPAMPLMPEHADCGPIEAALRNVIAVSCLSETVAVALIQAERQEADLPGVAEVLRSIFADEVQHARLGWVVLDALAPAIDGPMRERLDRWLAVAFAHLEAHEVAHLGGACPTPDAARYGVCDGAEATALFYETVASVIVPQLEARGLAAGAAWRLRHAVA